MKNALIVAGALLACVTIPVRPCAAKPVVVDIKNAAGQSIGTATLTDAAPGVRIKLDIRSLPPGEHSIHIHQVAKCEPPDFKSAGPHVSVVAPKVTLASGDHSVFSNGGTAIVIHAVSNETNSGAPPRIACGVISK